LNETEYGNYEIQTVVSLVLIQIRELDKYILNYVYKEEWIMFRTQVLSKTEQILKMKSFDGINFILDFLRYVREKLRLNKKFELHLFAGDDEGKIVLFNMNTLENHYQPILDNYKKDNPFIKDLNKQTINELIRVNREFNHKIESRL